MPDEAMWPVMIIVTAMSVSVLFARICLCLYTHRLGTYLWISFLFLYHMMSIDLRKYQKLGYTYTYMQIYVL